MWLKIAEGKIFVGFDDPELMDRCRQMEDLLPRIGSLAIVDEEGKFPAHQLWAKCTLSHVNLVKLKGLRARVWINPATGTQDAYTLDVLKEMRGKRDVYDSESALAEATKKGKVGPSASYPFKVAPWGHQRLGFDFMHAVRNPAIFGECGSGKTMIVSSFAESLVTANSSWFFFVVCPVNLIKHVWLDDVEKFTSLQALSLRPKDGTAKKKLDELKELTKTAADVYVINPENIRIVQKDRVAGGKVNLLFNMVRRLLREGKKMYLVVDESSKIKSKASATYRVLRELRSYAERCTIMTGTPSPLGILDLWPQFHVLDLGETLQPSFTDYRKDFAQETELKGVSYYSRSSGKKKFATKWTPKPLAPLQVHSIISPRAVRFRGLTDLPPVRFLVRNIEMSKEQAKVYSEMEDLLFTSLEGQSVTAQVAVVRLMKLREITGGFIISDNRSPIAIGKDSPKMLELDMLLEQSIEDELGVAPEGPPPKALIWAQYQWECKTLIERYGQKYGAQGLFGGISTKDKDYAIESFRKSPTCRVLVCHPASAGHGLTLTEANYAFWYSHSYSFEEFYQSTRRHNRPGQKRSIANYLLVCPGTIDEDILEALADKKDLSDIITDGAKTRDDLLLRRRTRKGLQLKLNQEVTHEDPSVPPGKDAASD